MNDTRSGTARRTLVRRSMVLLPVVVVSASWTVSVACVGGVPVAAGTGPARVPARVVDPVAVPEQAVTPPASVARPDVTDSKRSADAARPVVAAAPIPATALAAYQRAAVVIGGADEGCRLEWPVVAAIGKVESDHGRVRGSSLDEHGVARPAIVGLRLDGRRGTARISDTDGGRLDGDTSFDRAVGPMQFIPTTWGVVGVDADSDGVRNPQDIDDAALATAVYLCSGDADLGTPSDLRAAVLRYNHSQRYADLVLTVARAYASSSVVPVAAGYDVPAGLPQASTTARDRSSGSHAVVHPTQEIRKAPSKPRPAKVEPTPRPKPAEPDRSSPVQALLTQTQAVVACTLRGLTYLLQPARFEECVEELTTTK